jgi:hypothetical protein
MKQVEKLLSIASEPVSQQEVIIGLPDFSNHGLLGEQLVDLLSQKNGFYAFESALHLFPATAHSEEIPLSQWNTFGLWRHEYGELAHDQLFFAEDAFGNQFCLHQGQVCSFDAETGELKPLGRSLEEWARHILDDYQLLTAYPLLHQWQLEHGRLPVGMRLMPKIPFVLGGEFTLQNLYPITSVSGMRTRGNLAKQIKDLPDGAQVKFRIIE